MSKTATRRLLAAIARPILPLLAVALAPWAGPAARAESVGYTLAISEGLVAPPQGMSLFQLSQQLMVANDCPLIVLTNTSTNASITSFEMTIGDTSYNFDALMFVVPNPSVMVTSFSPDTIQGGVRGDLLSLQFSGFTPSQQFGVRADVDRDADNGLSFTNFRTALIAAADPVNRAHVTVTFSDGNVLTDILSPFDATGNVVVLTSSFRCGPQVAMGSLQSGETMTVVPEPSTLLLAAVGAAVGVVVIRRQRRRAGSFRAQIRASSSFDTCPLDRCRSGHGFQLARPALGVARPLVSPRPWLVVIWEVCVVFAEFIENSASDDSADAEEYSGYSPRRGRTRRFAAG